MSAAGAGWLLGGVAGRAQAQGPNPYVQKLGYPADARLLVVRADDVGVCHSINMATFAALENKSVNLATVEVPAPWFHEVAIHASQHPEIDWGLHLDLTSEWTGLRWGPVASPDKVPSLVDAQGYLWGGMGPASNRLVRRFAQPADVERELRAQIERALRMGVRPTEMDPHQGMLFERPEFLAVARRLAVEYGIPLMTVGRSMLTGARLQPFRGILQDEDLFFDHFFTLHRPSREVGQWKRYYDEAIRNLQPGITLMVVHLAYNNPEFRAVCEGESDWGPEWRQADFDWVMSAETGQLLEREKIVLVPWRRVARLWPHAKNLPA